MAGQLKEISFAENAGDITVRVDGARVEFHADGSIQVYTNAAVQVSPIANDDKKPTGPAGPKIGEKMPDGTVYAGVSPDTGKPMYVTPADASLAMTFNQAKEYAHNLNAHGHHDWRMPSKDELKMLFNNRAAIGGFNVTGSYPAGWYWSASENYAWNGWCQRFSDGGQDGGQNGSDKGGRSSVRCVR